MTNSSSSSSVDLAQLFGSVAQTLIENQGSLNKADSYNHDHGDNMVQIFNTITQAIQEKPKASAAAQLGHASAALAKNTTSGSAKLYSQGLQKAAQQFSGSQSLTSSDAMKLVQLLLGSANTASTNTTNAAPDSTSGADLLGSLLGSLGGEQKQTSGSSDSKIDMADILNAGAAFLNAKQAGKTGLEAALAALVTDSTVANQDYRAQSATLVANTLINVVSQMAKSK
jgi:hypothetical protein